MSDKYLIKYEMENDAVIYIEATDEMGVERISGDRMSSAAEKFEQALSHIKPVAKALHVAFEELNKPKEINMEFGIKFSAKAGVVFASADSEATFVIKLKWEN
ncbi:MAG: hypothetical protein CTY29_04310 [Methylobacter sp.]|nr:MAG: hypothetical protein CTY29_04310 [Methylobacter sp.]